MVVIIDDREDVWNYAPNLIHVRPYHFFQHTGDINAPLGLSKLEKDDKEGFDFSSLSTDSEGNLKEDKSNSKESSKAEATATASTESSQSKEEPAIEEVNGETKDEVEDMDVPENNGDLNQNEKEDAEETSKVSLDTQEVPTEEEALLKEEVTPKVHLHDTDDYLLHLQDILRTIHHAYFVMYDDNLKKNESRAPVPDMKCVLPYVRRKVLEKINIVFSGVVPTNVPLDKSKPYLVAKSLGANVSNKVTEKTTHLIAARLGTTKVFLMFLLNTNY